jgi:hypothetical protein
MVAGLAGRSAIIVFLVDLGRKIEKPRSNYSPEETKGKDFCVHLVGRAS